MCKKLTCFLLILSILLPFVFTTDVQASTDDKELNIYVLYLNSDDKGDSTLLESRGHYLLIDIGAASHAPAIIRQLQTLGVSHVDIMFSHLHIDHTGGTSSNYEAGLDQFSFAGITIDTLYLPSPSLASLSRSYPKRYAAFQDFMTRQGTGQIQYLNVNDQISFGDVTGKIIGPVNSRQLSPYLYTTISSLDERYVLYENNCSLAAIFTCGNTRYFTAGDSYSDEANSLADYYGSSLKCDIMKLNHHGIGSGNSDKLLQAIQPTYSFIPNTGVAELDDNTGEWRTAAAIKQVTPYGLCYLVGNEKKTLIFHIKNDTITLYKGSSISSENKMTGWLYLYGADGFNRDHDMYYINPDNSLATGVKKIGEHYFYFRTGGQMDYGTYDSTGNYSGWRNYDGKKRYFHLSSNEKYAYMNYGIEKAGNETYYFDKKGYKIIPDNTTDDNTDHQIYPTKIGSSYYYIDEDGTLTINNWVTFDNASYYFGKTGKMYRNGVYSIYGDKYLFESDGTMVSGNGGTDLYDFKNKTYAIRSDGTLVINKIKQIDGKKYYFNSNGVMQTNKIITIGKLKYYFNSSGKLLTNKKIKLKGKTYYSNKNGVLSTPKSIKKRSK